MDLSGVFDEFWDLSGHEAEEGMQGREPQIPCVDGMAPFLFEVDQKVSHSTGFLRNKNAALPVRAQKNPLTLSGLKKIAPRWRQRPRTFAPQASVMAASVREDVGYEYTCFMRGGEDARFHERFSGRLLGLR